jgi:hypothetical protein
LGFKYGSKKADVLAFGAGLAVFDAAEMQK